MHYLEAVDVSDRVVDEIWEKVSRAGSYYSIADGVTKEVFRRMLFESSILYRAPSLIIRLNFNKDFVEIHPIAFGPSVFKHAREALSEIVALRDRLFAEKPICVIIPDGMRGAKRLAKAAGMSEEAKYVRAFSGVAIPCTVFTWR